MERFVGAEREKVMATAARIAKLLDQTWPQMTKDGILHYSISGSLSVALLAGTGAYTDIDGTEVLLPTNVLNRLRSSLHEIHDIDVENRVEPFPYVLDKKSDLFLRRAKEIMPSECTHLDLIDSIGIPAPAVAVDSMEGRFYVTRLDYHVGFKTLGVFFNYNMKHHQLNREVPLLISSAISLYGEIYIWNLIGYFFALNDELVGRYKRFGLDLTTDHLFELVASDDLISTELKEIMRQGMELRNLDTQLGPKRRSPRDRHEPGLCNQRIGFKDGP